MTRYYTHCVTNRHSWRFHSTHALLHALHRHSWRFHSTHALLHALHKQTFMAVSLHTRATTRTTQTFMAVSLHTRATTRTAQTDIHGSFTPHTRHLPTRLHALHSNNYHVRYSTRRLIRRWLVIILRLLVTLSDAESVSSFLCVHETRISMVCFVVLLSGQRLLWLSRQCLLVFRSQRCIIQRGERRTFPHPHRTDSASCRV